jgi:hypothetical protein
MRQVVIDELTERIKNFEKVAKPRDVGTGMTGSFNMFNYTIQSGTAMTQEEFDSCTYDDWLREEHIRVYKKVNNLLG